MATSSRSHRALFSLSRQEGAALFYEPRRCSDRRRHVRLFASGVTVTPEIRHVDQNCAIATWDRVLLQVWRGEATPRALQWLSEAGRALLAANAGYTCCSLSIIEAKSPPPSEQVRPLLAAVYRELAPGMRHQLFVAEGSGFRAAIVRGVGLAVSAFVPSLLPFKFASSVEDAADTIAPCLSPNASGAGAILEALVFLRARLDEQTAP